MTEPSVRKALDAFVADRKWEQFHSVENLIKSIAIEAGELLECVQWNQEIDQQQVRDELADVLTYCQLLAAKLKFDPDRIILEKLARTEAKYPVDKSRGTSARYDQLDQ